MLNDKDEIILQQFFDERGSAHSTQSTYIRNIKLFCEFNKMSLSELFEEARNEEDERIPWRDRKLRQKLIDYRVYVYDKYMENTAKTSLSNIMAVYRHYSYEILQLPYFNPKNITKAKPVYFTDLPNKEIIMNALEISNQLLKSIILFISSSGCSRTELLNLTVQDFIDSCSDYVECDNIDEFINEVLELEDIIPIFYHHRQKTNYEFVTFCTPEAAHSICNYLLTRERLTPFDNLFKISGDHLSRMFRQINKRLDLGKSGTYNVFTMHKLRKFHSATLINNGVPIEKINHLQGRVSGVIKEVYMPENPERLKEIYLKNMNDLMIYTEIKTIESPEIKTIKAENTQFKEDMLNMKAELEKMKEILSTNYGTEVK